MNVITLVQKDKYVNENNAFKITYNDGTVETFLANAMGTSEETKGFITFYFEEDNQEHLVCMIQTVSIKKIEAVFLPSILRSELQNDAELFND